MQKINSKINSYASNVRNINVVNNNFESQTLRVLLWSFGFLSLCYILILGNMVSNIIARKGYEMNARTLSSDVGDLELSYLSLSNNVDLSMSYSLGFKEAKPTFATRKTVGFKNNDSVAVARNDI